MRPASNEAAEYFFKYIHKVPDGNLIDLMETIHQDTQTILSTVSEDKGDYQYAEGKWSIKEVIQHTIDTERIMAYRALRIARGDKTALPGFDQDEFAKTVDVSNRSLADLMSEFQAVRTATIALFKSFTADDFARIGTASNMPISTNALGYLTLGHEMHHLDILQERYL